VTLGMLGVGYLGVGVALAIGLGIARRISTTSDAILMVGLWPLWAPLQLAQRADAVIADSHERELLHALARAKTSPIASVLPDAEGARVLATRLREAGLRLGELETVLARPDFDPAAVEQHARTLEARGATAAAATARLRVRTLEQLRTLRERYRAELDEVHELIAQLVTQAELVRLGELGHDAGELVNELVARIEGLGDLFAVQASIEPSRDRA
jgi:hypothetical protein